MKVTVDRNSGFCFGVQFAVDMAESELRARKSLYSLGEIVHNTMEVERLEKQGLKTITPDEFKNLRDTSVFIRAHGEPPETYRIAAENNIELIDASCPIVVKLQRRIRDFYDDGYQVLIYGKHAHPEVIGLNGQCKNEAIIIKHPDLSDPKEIERLDFGKKTVLFSQTTQDTAGFYLLKETLEKRFAAHNAEGNFDAAATEEAAEFLAKDTICRQVSNRDEKLIEFSKENERVIFVAGKKSSNGKVLFGICKAANPNTFFAEDESELEDAWFRRDDGTPIESIGICGATSTPVWLMEKIADHIRARRPGMSLSEQVFVK